MKEYEEGNRINDNELNEAIWWYDNEGNYDRQ